MIRVRGARVHNLRDLDVDIPRGRLVVFTGVSGSGKSSLAFDTIYSEGQRRYVESLSAYARQFVEQLEPPDVDLIEGLPPTVAIDQKFGLAGPRATVATITEMLDYLRVLFARTGVPHCAACGAAIARMSPEQMVGAVLSMAPGRKLILLAPLARGKKGQHLEAFETVRRAGLLRARVDGELLELGDTPPKLAKTKSHTIEAVVDRLVVREGIRPRLSEAVDLALRLSGGSLVLSVLEDNGQWIDRALSTRYACPLCGTGLEEVEPRTFSFNSPHGACPTCQGLGSLSDFDPELLVSDRSRSLRSGGVAALDPLVPKTRESFLADAALSTFLRKQGVGLDVPLGEWPADALRSLISGTTEGTKPPFAGLLATLRAGHEGATRKRRESLDPYRTSVRCPSCLGARLRPEARAVQVGDWSLPSLLALTASEARNALDSLAFVEPLDQIGPPLVREVARRLQFLDRVGLGYLTLDRSAESLSGGEFQRVRLAAQIGSGLVGVAYVLDEPTAGLHPKDTERLLACLVELRDQGNTVLVVEHDEATIRAADWLLDLGPGAGPDGGRLVAHGPAGAIVESEPGASLTLRYLNAKRDASPARSSGSRLSRSPGSILVKGAAEHNLRGIDARFPLGALTCVTGVSGSGKSTLVLDILARAARRRLGNGGAKPGTHDSIEGLEAIQRLLLVDQSPIGRSPRSTPATYTGVFDEIRKVFATTREARLRGYGAPRFSFNAKGGRCERCEGQGLRKVEMNFLPEIYVTCEECRGLRFNRPTLEARFRGKSIGEVLRLRVDEARALFDSIPRVKRGLDALHEAGLGYITLGQSSTTLSGGEAQRVKLATELGGASGGESATLTILDEPTTGLHFADVENLLRLLRGLADRGHTVVVIEHHLDVIRAADWIVDLGPEGGGAGGRLVAMGPPSQVEGVQESHTGRYLAGPPV